VIDQLLARGCQRIALINHDLSYKYARSREEGYRAGLKAHQRDYTVVEYASDLSFSAGKAAMQVLLRNTERPDAVFAVSDTRRAVLAIHEAGLKMPQDIAVVGFDGTELAEMVTPPLTTVYQPSKEIGRRRWATAQ
jgi:DNA-binding LacI/PurR family transcriptional regulator